MGGDPEPNEADEAHEADALLELGDRITTLAASIHAATHRLLVMLADFDRRGGWKASGAKSCADWLSFNTGISAGAARERVRAARALVSLPETSAAMARGELSFAKVRAVTRVANPETEADLVEFARDNTAAALERLVRSWRVRNRMDEAEFERELHRSRTLSVFPDGEGMYLVRGRLDAEVGALLMRAIEAASDALFCENPGEENGTAESQLRTRVLRWMGVPGNDEVTPEQRRADAIGLLAERALAMGFGTEGRSVERRPGEGHPVEGRSGEGHSAEGRPVEGRSVEGEPERTESRHGEPDPDPTAAQSSRIRSTPAPLSGIRAERYQVVLHVDSDTLSEDREPGRSHLADGTRVSAETSRRLSCDAAAVWMKRAPDGSVLGVGRRTRTVPPATRRALEVRDHGCRFPGCGSGFTDAHHVRHWADGGETSLENLVLLCRRHHRMVHEGGFQVAVRPDEEVRPEAKGGPATEVSPVGIAGGVARGRGLRGHPPHDRVIFYDPRGFPLPSRPPRVRLSAVAAASMERDNRRATGTSPDWATAGARYARDEDVPLGLMARAREAVLASMETG